MKKFLALFFTMLMIASQCNAATWYADYENGDDANSGKGWWKLDYTSGGTYEPSAGETITGDVSFASAKIISITVDSGSWAGGDAAGTFYLYGKSGTFEAENLDIDAEFDIASISGDAPYDSKRTIGSLGINASLLAAGDNIRIAKSPDPTAIGNVTFTDNSETLTLASALTTTIDDCEVAWTGSTNVITNVSSYHKEGTYSAWNSIADAFTAGLIAYRDISTLDLSGKQQVTFWMRTSIDVAANTIRLDLCSDDAGATAVNSFTVDVVLKANKWYAFTFDNGSALGSAIESVALTALLDPGAATIYIDNIEACNASSADNSLSLTSLIGKNTGREMWYKIRSINGTTVKLQSYTGASAATFAKYQGTTETVTGYKRETIKTDPSISASTGISVPQENGTAIANVSYYGGYNPVDNTRDGETWYDGNNGYGYGLSFSSRAWNNYSNWSFLGYYRNMYSSSGNNITMDNCNMLYTTSYSAYWTGVKNLKLENSFVQEGASYNTNIIECDDIFFDTVNFSTQTTYSGYNKASFVTYINCNFYASQYGYYNAASAKSILKNCTFKNIQTTQLSLYQGRMILYNCAMDSGVTECYNTTNQLSYMRLMMYNYDQTADRFKAYTFVNGVGQAGIISDQITGGQAAAWAYGGSGLCLYVSPTQTIAGRTANIEFMIPVEAATDPQLKLYVKKTASAATCTLKIDIYDGDDDDTLLVDDASVTLTDTWTQQSITFASNPTIAGFCRVVLKGLDGSTTGDIGVDDISIVRSSTTYTHDFEQWGGDEMLRLFLKGAGSGGGSTQHAYAYIN